MIFLDTGFLFAYFNEEDASHSRVSAILEQHEGEPLSNFLLTTNHIVSETITLCRYRSHRDPRERHQRAVRVGQLLLSGALGRIHHATPEDEREAFTYFERHQDKSYSFTDCLSFVVMLRHGIDVAWTVDEDFNHRFTAVPGPPSQ